MADAHNNQHQQNDMEVEDAYSCVEDPEEPQNVAKKDEDEVDQMMSPSIEILLDFNGGVKPAGKVLPPRVQSLIGRMVYKTCSGVGYLGTVIDYDLNKRWFRVEYDDEGSEDLLESEVRNLLATSTQIEGHLQRLRESLNNDDDDGERHVEAAAPSTSSKPKRKRMGKSAAGKEKDDDAYIPMSKRSGKKDDYFHI